MEEPPRPQDTFTTSLGRVWPAFVWSRIWVFAFAYLGDSQFFAALAPRFREGFDTGWLRAWTAYDSWYFLQIAHHGFTPKTSAFFPLYPMVLRVAGPDYKSMMVLGIIVSNVAFLAGLTMLYRLTARDFDVPTAKYTIWLLAFFPASAVFSAVYTESLFFFLIVSAFWFARSGRAADRARWAFAGVMAALAALTRNPGAVISIALFAELLAYWKQEREAGRPTPKTALLWVALPAAAFIAVQVAFSYRFGAVLSTVQAQALYVRGFMWPWMPIVLDVYDIVTLKHTDLAQCVNAVAVLAALFFLVRFRDRLPLSYLLLMGGILLMSLICAHLEPPYTVAAVRFMMTAFPFVVCLALWWRAAIVKPRISALLFIMYMLLNAVMSHAFASKSYLY